MMRVAALDARNQLVDRELSDLSSRVSALAPMMQPTQMVRYQPARIPARHQEVLNSQMEFMQENGVIREVDLRDGAVLSEPVWHRRPAARPERPGTQVAVPRGQEHTAGNVYCDQTTGATSSTGLAV